MSMFPLVWMFLLWFSFLFLEYSTTSYRLFRYFSFFPCSACIVRVALSFVKLCSPRLQVCVFLQTLRETRLFIPHSLPCLWWPHHPPIRSSIAAPRFQPIGEAYTLWASRSDAAPWKPGRTTVKKTARSSGNTCHYTRSPAHNAWTPCPLTSLPSSKLVFSRVLLHLISLHGPFCKSLDRHIRM